MYEDYAAALPETGDMLFQDYISTLRVNRVRAENWLRAKQAGVIETFLSPDGLRVRRPVVTEQEANNG